MNSLLSHAQKIDVSSDPFPHIIITDPLEEEICLQLLSEYPDVNTITKEENYSSNKRFSYSASEVFGNDNISPLWKQFVQVHTSNAFLSEVVGLFEEHIRLMYPCFEKEIRELNNLTSGVRKVDNFPDVDVLLDAQICVNTPVAGTPSSVRTAHVDKPNKLFAGLYYLRSLEDTSTGGDLEIYKFKDKPNHFRGEYIRDKYVEVVKTVKYQRNVLILFINSIYSVHGVTVRSKTNTPRYFFNLLGEVKQPLFDLSQYQEKKAWLGNSISAPAKALQNLKKMALHSADSSEY